MYQIAQYAGEDNFIARLAYMYLNTLPKLTIIIKIIDIASTRGGVGNMDLPRDHKSFSLGGQLFKFFIRGEENGGSYTLIESSVPARHIGSPPHIHNNEDLACYVIEGRFTFTLDDSEFVGEPGDFIFLPRGRKHWIKSDSDGVAKMLVFANPPGFERYCEAAGVAVDGNAGMPPPPTIDDLLKIVSETSNFGIDVFF